MNQGSTPSNVLSFHTGQPILPKQVRASIMGQYVESKQMDHTPEVFIQNLEKRLISDMAFTCAKVVKEFISETFGDQKND